MLIKHISVALEFFLHNMIAILILFGVHLHKVFHDFKLLVFFLIKMMVSSQISEGLSKHSFNCPCNALSLNNFSDVLEFSHFVDSVHVTQIDAEFTHVHFERVAINNDKFNIVEFVD